MSGPRWRAATTVRLLVALAATVLDALLLLTLIALAWASTTADEERRAALAESSFGWVLQAALATALSVALPWIWRWVRRQDREAAWLAGERQTADDGERRSHRGLSGEEPPPTRW